MRALIRVWIVCTGVAWAGVAPAAPRAPKPSASKPSASKPSASKVSGDEKYQRAVQLDANGEPEKALAVLEEGLAIAPTDRPLLLRLLFLKGSVLFKLRDYPGALAAYRAYLDAGAAGANRVAAQNIITILERAQSTFLELTLANGPATIYLGSKAQGVFCTAAPACNKAMLPGDYKVIAERSGFDRWTGGVTIESGKTAKLDITLVEKPSLLTVRAAQPGAHITVDDAAYDAPASVAAGSHRVVVSLAGHVEARLEATAHEGRPVELDVALTPLVPIHVEPPGAQLVLDDKPIAIQDGGIAIPPGAHVLVARAQGFQDRRVEIPAERAPDNKLVVELVRAEVAKPVVVPPAPSRFTGRRKIALAVGGVGVLAVAGGVVLGLQSRQLDRDTYALCPSPSTPCSQALEANDLNRRGHARALQANLAYGVAGAAAVAAAVLWLTGAPESRVAVTLRLDTVAGLDLAVRF